MKKEKHIYVNEIELKSILIRVKNLREHLQTSIKYNRRINQLIKTFLKLNCLKYSTQNENKKRIQLKDHLRSRIIKLSEITCADTETYNKFGQIIILTIKNILRKPQFNGYTYGDDFYSDASYKILRYLKNFDHTKISEISGQPVKAFAYLTQIINNSIIFIINQNKKNTDNISKEIDRQKLIININSNKKSFYHDPYYNPDAPEKIAITKYFKYDNFLESFKSFVEGDLDKYQKIEYSIPSEYKLNVDYLYLKEILKRKCKHIQLMEI